jgi:hypothetical protein
VRVIVVSPEPGEDHIHPHDLHDQKIPRLPPGAGEADYRAAAEAVGRYVGALRGSIGPRAAASPCAASARRATRRTRSSVAVSIVAIALGALVARLADERCRCGRLRGSAFRHGDIGKSLLAKQYALKFEGAYPGGVFWLRAPGDDGGSAPAEASAC